MSVVLVTRGSGFIGGRCILQLLAAGHEVRMTVRNRKREPEVRALFEKAGATGLKRLSFVAADFERDAGCLEAVAGSEFVLDVASPFHHRGHLRRQDGPFRAASRRPPARGPRRAGARLTHARSVSPSCFAGDGGGRMSRTRPPRRAKASSGSGS